MSDSNATQSSAPHDPTCVLCLKNGKLKVLQTSPSGNSVFIQVAVKEGDEFVPVPGAYFVLPAGHFGPKDDMPFDFLSEVNWHVRKSGLEFDNGSFNYTKAGGAKITGHAHYWLVEVQDGEPPLGLHGLRAAYRQLQQQ